MASESSPRPRPYWHVDAKWIAGLLLTFVLGLTLVAFSLVQVTAEKPAVDVLSMAMAVSLSGKGLDDETEIAEMRLRLAASPTGEIQPFPGLTLTIREEDFAGKTGRQARLSFFRKLAEPIYRQGGEGLAELATDAETRAAVSQGVGVASFFSLKTHLLLQRAFTILLIACAALALPLIFFSYRFGRLGSPGCVLVVASLPGAALLAFFGWAFRPPLAAPSPEAGMSERLGALAAEIVPPLAQLLARTFLYALALGLALIVLSFVGAVVFRRRRLAKDSPRVAGPPSAEHADTLNAGKP
jgi:hypothetical protein